MIAAATTATHPLYLPASDFRRLLEQQGPSLALWRAAEIAALREQCYAQPLLDLGCGDGLVTALVLPCVDIGVDPDSRALERAACHGIYAHLLAGPVEEVGLPPLSVNTVVSNSVLEHLPQIDRVLQTVVRLLRPGGQLIFTAPTAAFSTWLFLPAARYAAWRNRVLDHHNLWSPDCWAEHLAYAGLEVELVRPYLRRPLVWLWDVLELLQQIWIARRRLVSLVWRRIPPALMQRLAHRASRCDLAAPAPGGGHLIVARKK
jgi:SAM-dependent methyltransferase